MRSISVEKTLLYLVLFVCIIIIILLTRLKKCNCKSNKSLFIYQNSQFSQDISLYHNFFQNKENGFFVELGAYDGIDTSNTIFFEKNFNWQGILIEGGEKNCKALENNSKQRNNSIIICSAICNTTYVSFNENEKIGTIVHNNKTSYKCNTLKNITSYYNIKHIDLFSLDVEGSELEVLETFDFNVSVSYWLIEWINIDNNKKAKIENILNNNGYFMNKKYTSPIDKVFSKKN